MKVTNTSTEEKLYIEGYDLKGMTKIPRWKGLKSGQSVDLSPELAEIARKKGLEVEYKDIPQGKPKKVEEKPKHIPIDAPEIKEKPKRRAPRSRKKKKKVE